MNGGNPPKSLKGDAALDKLTNLPSHVVDQILSRLPIRDAVRTSVLSSQWRYKWTTMSNLVFDKDWISVTPKNQRMMKKKLANLIDHILLLHTVPVSKFMLYRRDSITTTDIDRWIIYLSRCLVQEFILEIWDGECYKLHAYIFSFQDLVHLDLYRCHLQLPSTFGGFKKLKTLCLKNLTMAQDVFETLISNCPILESLTLVKVDGFTHLNIDAPNLLKIVFNGYFNDINFFKASNLEILSIILDSRWGSEGIITQDSSNLLKFLSSLPRIRRLVIDHDFMQYLAVGDLPEQLSNLCPNLGYLYLEIGLNDYAECSAALFLLRSCPNIQELEMRVHLYLDGDEFTFWESEHKKCSFNRLRTVNISGITGSKNELELIRFMLKASPVLQKMIIKHSSKDEALQLARKLLRFQLQRASPKAEVVFLESSTTGG